MTARQKLHPAAEAIYNERLTAEECTRYLALPPSAEESESISELLRWFSRRYPTAKERLAYARRKYAEWTRPPSEPFEPR